MRNPKKHPFISFAVLCLMASTLFAEGGKWTPEQILEHDPTWLKELGLEIPPEELWSSDGGGLLEAIVQVDGCSSGFISADGLLVTNHHCAFGLVQLHSTAERNLIEDGFIAANRSEELSGEGTRASIPHRFTDVTQLIEASVPSGADGLVRWKAIDAKKKALVADCEAKEYRRCRLATYDDGVRYVLIEAREFPDVRLVYAPPRSIGEFGGEVDNWMWPRHTGDFALLRVYGLEGKHPAPTSQENAPYRPEHFLKVAQQGISEGDFAMVVGYPGSTKRRLIAPEMAELRGQFYPTRARVLRDWMDILEASGEKDEAAAITLSSRLKYMANVEKNARGQITGIDRGNLVGQKKDHDQAVLGWAQENPEHQGAIKAYAGLEALAEEEIATRDRDFLMGVLYLGPTPLNNAMTVARWALESEKEDANRNASYQERNRKRSQDRLLRSAKRIHLPSEVDLLEDWLRRVESLPAGQEISPLISWGETPGRRERIQKLFQASPMSSVAGIEATFSASLAEIQALEDPLLELALQLEQEVSIPAEEDSHRRTGEESIHRPIWRKAVAANAGRPIDPDANGTLRVSLARVQGYSPRDGIWMRPQTRLAGVLEKHTGEDPFSVPEKIQAQAPKSSASAFADPNLGDVPVCFLATGDTTGGSSGSPVLNGRGELVGVNFDRVWENIANDFGYNPEIARNVSVDTRYLLWLLESVEGEKAQWILEEMGVEAK